MDILVTRCLKRSSLVQDLFETWQLDHREAMFASDVEELCGECLELCGLCKHVWDALRSHLPEIADTEKVGRGFQKALEKSTGVVQGVLELCEKAGKKGYQIKGGAELAAERANLRTISMMVERDWPFIDKAMIETARAAYLRGEFQAAEELLNAPEISCP